MPLILLKNCSGHKYHFCDQLQKSNKNNLQHLNSFLQTQNQSIKSQETFEQFLKFILTSYEIKE